MDRRDFIRGLAVLAACPLCGGLAHGQEAPHWTYEGEHGPDHWGQIAEANSACSLGGQQSPVDITGATQADLPPIQLSWQPSNGVVVNNGHTIQINMPTGNTLTRGARIYDLLQFHFHAPSEHLVEGSPFAMEVHFVHKRADTGDLGVLGVFLTPGAANDSFAKLAAAFPTAEGEVELEGIDATGLLPGALDYWAYEGSLTTPPCSEIVDWMVAKNPITVDIADIERFSAIYAVNARPVLPANRRFILSSS